MVKFIFLLFTYLHFAHEVEATTQCYSCGYMKKGDSIAEEIPEIPFCNDFANTDDNVVSCGEDDCCGMLKEYFIRVDEATGENRTDVVGRHGCAADMEHLSHYSATCKENGESCWQVDDASLDPNHGQGNATIFQAEICLCGRDKCNNADPVPEVPTTAAPSGGKMCYDCGYLIDGWTQDGPNYQHPMTDGTPQCGDEATLADHVTSCADEGECCGVVREFYIQEATNITEEFIQVKVRHGCEKTLAEEFSDYHEIICDRQGTVENKCTNISFVDIPEHEATFADVCFCNTDKCNNDVPVMPDPDVPTSAAPGPTPCPECTKCYSCGYRKKDNGEAEGIPETPFCNDFANPEENVVSCGKEDCCGMLKEYFITVDDATGENSTMTVGRHGCAADMEHLSHYSATCKDNGESCWQVDEASLDHNHGQGNATIIEAEICLCGRDMCNNADPVPEVPTTTAAPGSASQATVALFLFATPFLLL